MTEAQAQKLIEQVQQEFPGKIYAFYGKGQDRQKDTGYLIKFTLIAGQKVLFIYQPKEWQSIKWVWGLEDAAKPPVIHYQVEGFTMTIHQSQGYWYGRYQHNGQSCKYYFGKVDPRPQYPIVEKEKEKLTL